MAILNHMRGKMFIGPLAGLALGGGIAGLGGLFSGGKSAPSAQDIAGQFGPEQLRVLQEALFNLIGGGASFQGQLARSNVLGQSAGQRIAASSARKGLSSTGVGAIASGIGSQLGGFSQQNLLGQLDASSLQAALGLLGQQLQAFTSLKGREIGQPTTAGRVFGAAAGAAGPSLLDLLGGGQSTTISPGDLLGKLTARNPQQPFTLR